MPIELVILPNHLILWVNQVAKKVIQKSELHHERQKNTIISKTMTPFYPIQLKITSMTSFSLFDNHYLFLNAK